MTTSRDTILVLTHWFDPTADYVVTELTRRRFPVFRWDLADFPQKTELAAEIHRDWSGYLATADRIVSLSNVRSVYYRRPTQFEFPTEISDAEQRWATREARAGVGGILGGLPGWINHPRDVAYAEYKPVQLREAVDAGLTIPNTLITNSVTAAREFAARFEKIVVKPLAGSSIAESGEYRLIYANPVAVGELDESVSYTAHQFQSWVPKAHEVRLTVVDDNFYAASIHPRSAAAQIDWRSDYDHLDYAVCAVPAEIRASVQRLMSALRLRFGALDFIVTPTGDWVFLEINPNGQWAWIEDKTGLPITSGIADALTRGDPR